MDKVKEMCGLRDHGTAIAKRHSMRLVTVDKQSTVRITGEDPRIPRINKPLGTYRYMLNPLIVNWH